MEHTNPVECAPQPAAARRVHSSPHGTMWSGADGSGSSWADQDSATTLRDQMEQILGEGYEPDPLFFVETWTSGIEAAGVKFQERHPSSRRHEAGGEGAVEATAGQNAFSFSVAFCTPLIFVHDLQSAASHDGVGLSSGFSAAWKDAYESSPSSSVGCAGEDRDAPFTAPVPGQALRIEEACRMLGVSETSTRKQIKTAYRQLVWRYHPDRLIGSSEQDRRMATDRMTSLNEAYHLLCGTALNSI